MHIACIGDSLTEGLIGSAYVEKLRALVPEHTVVNLGKGDETVISLYHRLSKTNFTQSFDMAFLWIGVNDVWRATPWAYRLAKAMLRKPQALDTELFTYYYQQNLTLLCEHAQHIITIPPVIKGENLSSEPNQIVAARAELIANITQAYPQASYLDLRNAFVTYLGGRSQVDYLPTRPARVILDALLLRDDVRIDQKAQERGLHLTLDGIHLNSTGAALVTESLAETIKKYSKNSSA